MENTVCAYIQRALIWQVLYINLRILVVCEKPFTPTSHEADELVALADKQKKLLAVYQSKSHAP